MVLQRNYLDVYFPYDGWAERTMPTLRPQEVLVPDELTMIQVKHFSCAARESSDL